jgi:hypothetical protein
LLQEVNGQSELKWQTVRDEVDGSQVCDGRSVFRSYWRLGLKFQTVRHILANGSCHTLKFLNFRI